MTIKKDAFHAKLAFILSLFFWVPLFNIGFVIASLILAGIALKKNYSDPEHFDGRGFATAAIILSITGSVGLIIFLISQWSQLALVFG